MEQRLLRYIMTPAMAATWILGIALVLMGQWFTAGWFHAKFVLVIAMTITQGLMSAWATDFRHDRNKRPQKFYRIANEIPTVLMIVIDTVTSGSALKGKIIIRSIGAMLRTAVVVSVACLIPTSSTRRPTTRR